VLGDKQILWKSQPMHKEAWVPGCDPPARATVSLSGVRLLCLRVYCPGVPDNSHTVWIDPLVRGCVRGACILGCPVGV
jgi:hypothetical protein